MMSALWSPAQEAIKRSRVMSVDGLVCTIIRYVHHFMNAGAASQCLGIDNLVHRMRGQRAVLRCAIPYEVGPYADNRKL
jgi:hypothetical protein